MDVDTNRCTRMQLESANGVESTRLAIEAAPWRLIAALCLERSGTLLASLIASLPAWTLLDPLSILKSFKEKNQPDQGDEERWCDPVPETRSAA